MLLFCIAHTFQISSTKYCAHTSALLGVVFASVRALLCRCYAPKMKQKNTHRNIFQSVTEAATATLSRLLAGSHSFCALSLSRVTATVVVVATAALSQSVAAVSLLVYFAGVVFALVVVAAGRAAVCVLRARESAEWFGNLSTNCERGECLYALKFAMWKKLSACVCMLVCVCGFKSLTRQYTKG